MLSLKETKHFLLKEITKLRNCLKEDAFFCLQTLTHLNKSSPSSLSFTGFAMKSH